MIALQHNETADNYVNTLAVLGEGWRVVVCKGGIQWILQRRDKNLAGGRWRGVRYHLTRDALIRSCAALCGPCDPAALAALAALPTNFTRSEGAR